MPTQRGRGPFQIVHGRRTGVGTLDGPTAGGLGSLESSFGPHLCLAGGSGAPSGPVLLRPSHQITVEKEVRGGGGGHGSNILCHHFSCLSQPLCTKNGPIRFSQW